MVEFPDLDSEEWTIQWEPVLSDSIVSSCFDVIVDLGIAKLELWPTYETQEPLKRFFIGEAQSYYRYEGDFGPVRVKVSGEWTGQISYYDQIS